MTLRDRKTASPASGQSSWATLPCTIDEGLGSRAAIGLLALASDGVIESELRAFLDMDGVAVFVSRIKPIPDTAPSSLRMMEDELPDATERLMPGKPLDVIAFGCTSGAMAIGAEQVAAKIRSVRPAAPITDPVSASLKALARLGAGRVALLTPYVDSVNEMVDAYFAGQGLAVTERGSFKQTFATINRISEDDVARAAIELGSRDVDAVFISCTGLRCSSVLENVERAIGKPVVASNQALAWDLLRLAGVTQPVAGRGQLLTAH